MEEKTFKIVLADGTEIKDLIQNGSNYVSKKKIDETVFEENCAPMSFVDSEGNETVFEHGEFIQQATYKGVEGYYLAFREKSEDELKAEMIQSQIDYLAMMTDVEL